MEEEKSSGLNNLKLNLLSFLDKSSNASKSAATPSLHLSIEIQTSSKKPVLLDKLRQQQQQQQPSKFELRQRLNGTQRPRSQRLPTGSPLPAYFYLSSSPPQLKANNNFNRQQQYYSSIHDQQQPLAPIGSTGYKSGNNELYSIFISMFTAAVFLIFIMWRWIRIKSDLRQALREQNEIEREMRLNGSSSSSTPPNSLTCTGVSPRFDINAFRCSYNRVNPNLEIRRQRLEALINQLSSSPNRDSYHNRQILATAKYCLHQLRMQAQRERNAAERDYLSSYFSYGQRYDRSLFESLAAAGSSSTATSSTSTTPSSITPLNRNHSISSFGIPPPPHNDSYYHHHHHHHLHHSTVNESPPSYESLMTKSSSLPSYCHLSNINSISTISNNNNNNSDSKNDIDRSNK